MAPVISYRATYPFGVPPGELWTAMSRTDRFEVLWSWLHDFRHEGPGLVDGAVLRGTVIPPVPYRMRVEVHLVRCEPCRSIDAEVHGDLEGRGTLVIDPDGTGSKVGVAWTVEMMRPEMRLADRVAHPLLAWGHDRVVDLTVRSFRRHVEQ